MGQDKTQQLIKNWFALFHYLSKKLQNNKIKKIKQFHKERICL